MSNDNPSDEASLGQPRHLLSIDPVTLAAAGRIVRGGHCDCLRPRTKQGRPGVPILHADPPAVHLPGWSRILERVDEAAAGCHEIFEPSALVPPLDWMEIATLPSTIGRLTRAKALRLYGSHLKRLPPELGGMSALEDLDIYTSYSLHWLPYEVTRCRALRDSRMSTRALYGNRKTLLPFPRLRGVADALAPRTCSICDQPFGTRAPHLFWTTQRLATDDVPLLIHSCSATCTDIVPDAPAGYYPRPHKGGGGVGMPEPFRYGPR